MSHADRKATLLARRAELTAQIRTIEDQLDDEPPRDWEDRSTERQGDEVLEAMGQQDLTELRAIDAALARIAEGTYGICAGCGNEISDLRLDAVPTAALCKACAR